jgi:hypothetical protein
LAMLTVIFQLVVPVKLRKDIFFICTIPQDDGMPPIILFHPGTCGAAWLKTWWPGPRPACTATSRPGLFTSLSPQWHFSHPNIDLVGLLQFTNNCNFIFTIIDFTSNRIEAIPLSSYSAADCARALVSIGLPVLGYPLRFLLIADCNLHQMYGLLCTICSAFRNVRPLLIL